MNCLSFFNTHLSKQKEIERKKGVTLKVAEISQCP